MTVTQKKKKPAECTRAECPFLRDYDCLGQNCDYYGKQQKPLGCTLEDIPCPDLIDEFKCPGKSCLMHQDYEPTDEKQREKAMRYIRYGEDD